MRKNWNFTQLSVIEKVPGCKINALSMEKRFMVPTLPI